MTSYILRRIPGMVVLLIVVSAVTFVIFNLLPSADPAVLRAGRQPTPEVIAQIKIELGLDRPKIVQFLDYLKGVFFQFDFGRSYVSGREDVRTIIFRYLPATIWLTLGGVIVWMTIGLSVGMLAAVKHRSKFDRLAIGLSLVAVSAPVYWLGLVVLYMFSPDYGVIPLGFVSGQDSYVPPGEDFVGFIKSMILPWFVIATTFAAVYARLLRGSLLDALSEDYVRTARAKGLSEARVIVRHGVRSAITPVITVLGLDIGILLGGAILTETVFNLPGIGRRAYQAITASDLPVIQGTVLFGALFIVVANLVVDILYAYLDPRVRR